MSHIHMFFNFIRANCKRLLHYLPSMFVSLLLLLLLTGTAGFYLSRHLYKENVFSAISIGYYLPQDDNLDLNQLGIGMLQDLEGMEETVQLVQVNSVEEGYNMLASHEILYLIIVPEQFFSGIMDSTNVPLDIVVYDNSSISSYIINELFMSYAGLLGTAQAGIYSGLDTTRAHEFTPEAVSPKPRTYTGSKHDPYIFSSVYPVPAVLYRNLHLDGARKPERTSDDHPCTAFDCTADRRNRNLFQKYLFRKYLSVICCAGACLLRWRTSTGCSAAKGDTADPSVSAGNVCNADFLPRTLLNIWEFCYEPTDCRMETNFTSKAILVHAGRPAHLNWNLCIASSEKPVHRNPCCPSLYQFYYVDASTDVIRDVQAGDAECGFVLPDGFFSGYIAGSGEPKVSLYETSASTLSSAICETFFHYIFKVASPQILVDTIDDAALSEELKSRMQA